MFVPIADSRGGNLLAIIALPFQNNEFLALTSQSLSCLWTNFSMKLTDLPEQSFSTLAKVDLAKGGGVGGWVV